MFYRQKFDAFIHRYGNTGFTSYSLLDNGDNGVNDTADLLIRKTTGGGQDKASVRREDFVGADEAIDRKSAGTKISGSKRNSQRIESVFTGNLADNTIIAIQINQNQRRTAFVTG
jgi:hypothetical protein